MTEKRADAFEKFGNKIKNVGVRLGLISPSVRIPLGKSTHPPIFVRGLSRSGGTLTVTLLDSHPEIAMSYELYPDLLRGKLLASDVEDRSAELKSDNEAYEDLDPRYLAGILKKHGRKALNFLRDNGFVDLKTFIGRSNRSGIDLSDFGVILDEHIAEGLGLASNNDKLRLIERVALEKMAREGKSRWGLKCSDAFEEYRAVWPDAYFINIIRDGRDVLASQQNTGNFKYSAQEVGRMWSNTHLSFRELVNDPNANAYEISYEKLANESEKEVRGLCDFLGLPYSENILSFHENDLSIYRQPRGHLSIDRISRPIDASKIGRWKQEVSEEDLSGFMSEAEDAMKLFGYH